MNRVRPSQLRTALTSLVLLLMSTPVSELDAKKRKQRRKKKKRPTAELVLGQTAPEFSGTTVFGQKYSLGERSAPATVVIFSNLEESTRPLNEARKLDIEWESQNVVTVLVAVGGNRADVDRIALEAAAGWPVIPDPKRAIAARYFVSNTVRAVVLDKDSAVVAVHDDVPSDLHEIIRKDLAQLLSVPMPWGDNARRSTLLSFDTKYQFGRPPSDAGASTRWQPLAKYMGEVANVFIGMTSAATYEEFEKGVRSGTYELVNAGPALGVTALEHYDPVVRFDRRGESTYRGIFFARSGSAVGSVSELRGKTLALVSARSTSGGLYPVAALMKSGLVPEDDVRLIWVKTHRKVAEAVRDGKADAGACYDDCRDLVWKNNKERDAATAVIGKTEEIPNEMVFFRRDLPERKKERLRAALLSVSGQELVIRQLSRSEEPITGVARSKR
ncbi:MAG: PhnD/SsuA/transferrin family substrate-binding protein, partial [Myxococcota bacterium]